MARKTIDVRGQMCPIPLIQTRKALRETRPGDEIEVIMDNETSCHNVERFLSDNGVPHRSATENGVYRVDIRLDGAFQEKPVTSGATDAMECSPVTSGGGAGRYVVNLRSDKMGDGPDELGAILIQAFVNTLPEMSPRPAAITMYNAGVRLARSDSPVIASLRKLETSGVRVLVCGTCVNYFEMRDQVGVGVVSNMLDILTCLTGASHVVSP